MKAIKFISVLILTLGVILGPGIIISVTPGCSTSQQRKAYNSLYSIGQTVDSAYKSYLDLVVSGKVATNDVPKISGYYADFQRTYGLAVSVAATTKSALPSPEVSSTANRILSAITQAKGK